MRFLFVHQNFPAQYLHVLQHLRAQNAHELVFITEPNQNQIDGVRKVVYEMRRTRRTDIHPVARDLELAGHRAERVADAARQIRRLGFTPDIVVGHHGWGELLDIVDVWPDAPILGYFEYYYHDRGHDSGFDPEFPLAEKAGAAIRAMNSINHLALALGQPGQTPTRFQYETYPDWARPQIGIVPEGVRLDTCRPDKAALRAPFTLGDFTVAPGERLVTYVARNLEPYRGVHMLMRALPRILGARADVKVIMVGGDEVSYGARLANGPWRRHFELELKGRYDASRVHMPGYLPYETYVRLLQRSDVHTYLTYPFVASWSLREALACGCAVVASDVEPVREFVTHGRNGMLVAPLSPDALAETVLEVLENPKLATRLRQGARRYAERHLDIGGHLAAFDARVAEIVSR